MIIKKQGYKIFGFLPHGGYGHRQLATDGGKGRWDSCVFLDFLLIFVWDFFLELFGFLPEIVWISS